MKLQEGGSPMNVLQDVRELQETRKEHELRLAKLEKLMEASILDTQQLKLEMRLCKSRGFLQIKISLVSWHRLVDVT